MAIYRVTIAGAEVGEGPLTGTVERISDDKSEADGVEIDGHVSVGGLLQTAGRIIHEWSLRPAVRPRHRQNRR
ncbi:MAG: hypothetical protein GY772_14335 [bacterium]|nr:hypothetical protein [bacterium]